MELTRTEDVPFSLSDVSAAWLTTALKSQGLLKDGSVTDFTCRTVGEEAGFNGEVAILTPEYSAPEAAAPASLVIKIPTASKNRILGQTMGLYEKEIRFYRDIGPTLDIRVPRHYFSALDEVDDPDLVLERIEGLNRLPVRLVGVLMKAISWLVKMTPRRYVLLIEDLSQYRLGDQMADYSDAELRQILTAMASLHAQFWDSEVLTRNTWIQPMSVTSRVIQSMYLSAMKPFRKLAAENVSSQQRELVGWLTVHGVELTEMLGSEPPTLLHGDFRLDNICFDDATGEILLFDWQTMQNGPAGMDLAYFLSAALPQDASAERISEVITMYHEALAARGIELSRERLQWQYEMGMLAILHRILPTLFQDNMELGDGRGREMIQAWLDKTFSRTDHIDFTSILARRPA